MKLPMTAIEADMSVVVTHKGSNEQKRVLLSALVASILPYVYAMTDFDADSVLDMYTDDTLTLKLSGNTYMVISQTSCKFTQGNNSIELTPSQLKEIVVSTNHTNTTTTTGSSNTEVIANTATLHSISRTESITSLGLLATILDKVIGPDYESFMQIVKGLITLKSKNTALVREVSLEIAPEYMNISFGAASGFQINGSYGTSGYFFTSQGATTAPIWSAVSYTDEFTPADWVGATLTIAQSTHLLAPGFLQVSIYDSSSDLVTIGAVVTAINCTVGGNVTITVANPALIFAGFIHLTR